MRVSSVPEISLANIRGAMGRKKIDELYDVDNSNLYVTFSRRRALASPSYRLDKRVKISWHLPETEKTQKVSKEY